MPKETYQEQGDRSLLEICLDVHMRTSGSADYRAADQESDIAILDKAVKNWKPSWQHTRRFDTAVLNSIYAVLSEYELSK